MDLLMHTITVFNRTVTIKTLFICVFLLAFLLRLGLGLVSGTYHDLCRFEAERTALTLAREGHYANPYTYALPTGPTAHVTPPYTLFLALIFKLFGTGFSAEIILGTVTCAVSALRSALLVLLVFSAGLGQRTLLTTAMVAIVWIAAFVTEVQGQFAAAWEGALLLALVYAAYKNPLPSWSLRRAIVTGAAWGLLVMLNPVTLMVLAAFILLWLFEQRRAVKASLPRLAVSAGMVALVLLPWAARNHEVLGKWIWTRSNFGLELYTSFNPGAYRDMPSTMRESISSMTQHPVNSIAEATLVRQMGEVAYNRYKKREAIQYIKTHPSESLHMIFIRTLRFWFPKGKNEAHTLVSALFTLLALAGLPFIWRSNRRLASLLSVVLVVFPLTYYIIQWSSRYRIPIEWALMLLTGLTLSRLSERLWPLRIEKS
jgi:hypothetical protein